MTKDKALDLALEALTWANKEINGWRDDAYGYEPEDHPEIMSAIAVIKKALTQPAPVQEPVAKYIGECSDGSLVQLYDDVKKGTNFYTTPPAARRKPLTDEQIYAMCSDFHSWSEWDGGNFQKFWLDLCRAI